MERRILEAAMSGDARLMKHMALHDPGVLLATTPQGNTCLHISSVRGHEALCKAVVALHPSLLGAVNADRETPLLAAVKSGNPSAASLLLGCYRGLGFREAILKQDRQGCNALHHAIRRGHRALALELIAAEPALSEAVNNIDESPMFMAVMRDYEDVFEKLLEIPSSAHGGATGHNALHAAVRNSNSGEICGMVYISGKLKSYLIVLYKLRQRFVLYHPIIN